MQSVREKELDPVPLLMVLDFRLNGPTQESFVEIMTFNLVPKWKVNFHMFEMGMGHSNSRSKHEQNPVCGEFLVPWEKSE